MTHLYFHMLGGRIGDVPAVRHIVDEYMASIRMHAGEVTLVGQDELRGYVGVTEDVSAEVALSPEGERGALIALSASAVKWLGADRLALGLFALSDRLGAKLARTTAEGLTMKVEAEEIVPGGRLTGLHWFQYFSPAVAASWKPETWDQFRTLHSRHGALGLLLGADPLGPLSLAKPADVLGIVLRRVRARNPLTGEEIWLHHP
jgi:hypothetical protein